MREFDPTNDEIPEFDANWKRAEDAWGHLGVWLCDCCDANNPSKFLRQVADELDGKLKHSPADERIFEAVLAASSPTEPLTFAKVKNQLEARLKHGNGSLPRDFSLRRSVERLGFVLHKTRRSSIAPKPTEK